MLGRRPVPCSSRAHMRNVECQQSPAETGETVVASRPGGVVGGRGLPVSSPRLRARCYRLPPPVGGNLGSPPVPRLRLADRRARRSARPGIFDVAVLRVAQHWSAQRHTGARPDPPNVIEGLRFTPGEVSGRGRACRVYRGASARAMMSRSGLERRRDVLGAADLPGNESTLCNFDSVTVSYSF